MIKRVLVIFGIIVVLAIGALFISSGFNKRTDVGLVDHSVSEDGSVITVHTGLAGSMGYIRDINIEYHRDAIYCSFYSAFGGLNSSIGSKDRYKIKLNDASTKIYFDRGEAGSVLVLQKNEATNTWMQITLK